MCDECKIQSFHHFSHLLVDINIQYNSNFCQTEEIEACIDKTWIVSAQSETQKILLSEQPPDEPLVVRGPYEVYLKEQVVTYFTLLGKVRPEHKDDFDQDGMNLLPNFYCNLVVLTTSN